MPRRRRRDNRGGPRVPANPAMHSGPGATSSRTDGAPTPTSAPRISDTPGAPFGQGGDIAELEGMGGGMPGGGMGGAPGMEGGGMGGAGGPSPMAPFGDPFSDPTSNPDEDVLTGLQEPAPMSEEDEHRASDDYIDAVTFGPMLPMLEAIASREGSTVTLRNVVRRLRALLPPEFDLADAFSIVQDIRASDSDVVEIGEEEVASLLEEGGVE